jgi:small GTP-binding protein
VPLFKRREPKKEEPKSEPPRQEAPKAPQKATGSAQEAPGAPPEVAPEAPAAPSIEDELSDLERQIASSGEAGPEQAPEEDDADSEGPPLEDVLKETAAMPGEAPGVLARDARFGDLGRDEATVVKMAKKVVLLGDPAVGKTSLIKKYVQDVFDDRYLNTIGAKVMKKNLGVHRHDTGDIVDLKLILWDIAGQESFATVKKAYYKGASGGLIVCDITRRETMEHLHHWIENLFDVSGVIPLIIILNKADLEKGAAVTVEEVRKEFAPYEAPVYTTSAKTGFNVELVFHELGKGMTEEGGKHAKEP